METNVNNDNRSNNKTLVIILFAVLAISLGVNGYLLYSNNEIKKEVVILTQEGQKTVDEKTAIKAELDKQLAVYDSLFAANSEAKNLLGEERTKVEDLLKKLSASNGNYKKFKAEAENLRKRQDELLIRIKDLEDQNIELTETNVKLKKDFDEKVIEADGLNKQNEQLASTVDVGSRLRAYEVMAEGIKVTKSGKENATTKARRSNKIRTCFTLLENPIAKGGSRTLYMVVKDPSGQVLATGNESTFTSSEGQAMVYSAKKDVDYENKAVDICMYFGKEDMPKGKYSVDVYCDGYAIGSTTCELK